MDQLKDILFNFLDAIITILFLPLQLIMVPVDLVLSNFKELSVIPQSIGAIVQFIGVWPSTICYLLGINPILFNLIFTTLLLFVAVVPLVNGLKRAWEWIRP